MSAGPVAGDDAVDDSDPVTVGGGMSAMSMRPSGAGVSLSSV